MLPRNTEEEHRPATPLELLFDLCFVVAVAQGASGLHHALAEGRTAHALVAFPMVFFAIWWAWMNVTWFASAYDTDDVPYRLAILVQIAGALILAAGVPRAFDGNDFTVMTVGYCVMRVALVGQWLRAARNHRLQGDQASASGRHCALRYAVGVAACQVGWLTLLASPEDWRMIGWLVLVPAELAVPVWAERVAATAWHPGHIAERYGLFTIIVLGESVLASTLAVQTALDTGESITDLGAIAAGGLLTLFAMWWIYFGQPADRVLERARGSFGSSRRQAFVWGYGHAVVFASAAAVGAGVATAVDHATDHSDLSHAAAGLTVTVPVALFVLAVWAIHAGQKEPGPLRTYGAPVAAGLVLASTATGEPVLATGLILAALVAVSVIVGHCRS